MFDPIWFPCSVGWSSLEMISAAWLSSFLLRYGEISASIPICALRKGEWFSPTSNSIYSLYMIRCPWILFVSFWLNSSLEYSRPFDRYGSDFPILFWILIFDFFNLYTRLISDFGHLVLCMQLHDLPLPLHWHGTAVVHLLISALICVRLWEKKLTLANVFILVAYLTCSKRVSWFCTSLCSFVCTFIITDLLALPL